jgi:hypothetical protein
MDGINRTALMDGINGNGRHLLIDGTNYSQEGKSGRKEK